MPNFGKQTKNRLEKLSRIITNKCKPKHKEWIEALQRADEDVEAADKAAAEIISLFREQAKKHLGKGEYDKSLEYYTKATKLGDAEAHFRLATLYYDDGNGVDKDENKAVYHLEQGAIGGHPHARVLLASYETDNGRDDRAAKHFIIAANLGHDDSLKCLMALYKDGNASKERCRAEERS